MMRFAKNHPQQQEYHPMCQTYLLETGADGYVAVW
jgi:hypothetical protein